MGNNVINENQKSVISRARGQKEYSHLAPQSWAQGESAWWWEARGVDNIWSCSQYKAQKQQTVVQRTYENDIGLARRRSRGNFLKVEYWEGVSTPAFPVAWLVKNLLQCEDQFDPCWEDIPEKERLSPAVFWPENSWD